MSGESIAASDCSKGHVSGCASLDQDSRRELETNVKPKKKGDSLGDRKKPPRDSDSSARDNNADADGADSPLPGATIDVAEAFEDFAKPLENFLLGVLRNAPEAKDALQATFVKLMEKGDTIVKDASLKSWLFRVAYNEAMLIKRKDGVARKHMEKVAWTIAFSKSEADPIDEILADETRRQLTEALEQLSDAQRAVVKKRIYEGLKFREIAEQLDLPLGTVLARMHASLNKLKANFKK